MSRYRQRGIDPLRLGAHPAVAPSLIGLRFIRRLYPGPPKVASAKHSSKYVPLSQRASRLDDCAMVSATGSGGRMPRRTTEPDIVTFGVPHRDRTPKSSGGATSFSRSPFALSRLP